MVSFGFAVFSGAFLLFLVQPLIGKYILPWFGGGPGVWTTCLLFFQAMLLGGYAYAHGISRWLKPRTQVLVHLALLGGALAMLPITPAESWKPVGDGNPTWRILGLLAACLGLPYFVLSATGPLLQQWITLSKRNATPYRFYALSNAGSLLALVGYPVWVQPAFSRVQQVTGWSIGLAVFAVVCGACAWKVWKRSGAAGLRAKKMPDQVPAIFPTKRQKLFWLLLPACASVLLLATTNQMCQNVAVIPFLWVLPLALYLLSFILCFDSPRWYRRVPFALLLSGALSAMVWMLFEGVDAPILRQILIYSGGLFVCCMVCHGELYRLRPDPRFLTGFYLMISAGGALGGLFGAVLAPKIFDDFYELHLGLAICAGLFAVVLWRNPKDVERKPGAALWTELKHRSITRAGWQSLAGIGMGGVTVALGAALWIEAMDTQENMVYRFRNFYGTLSIFEYWKGDPDHYLRLEHGRVTHGIQFTHTPESLMKTTYYSEKSGVGLAINSLPKTPRRLGVVGLGIGTLAAYGRTNDYFRMYEINPVVCELAKSNFTYLSDSAARIEVVTGDARLSLEKEPPQQFDLLALDAFNGDAVPTHLLTLEAFMLYERHLAPGGIIAVHISNQYLDLRPVILNAALNRGFYTAVVSREDDDNTWWEFGSTWVLLSHDETRIQRPGIQQAARQNVSTTRSIPLWTDDFASLYQILD